MHKKYIFIFFKKIKKLSVTIKHLNIIFLNKIDGENFIMFLEDKIKLHNLSSPYHYYFLKFIW